MKNKWAVVAVVTGYTLVETLLLLSLVVQVPGDGGPSAYRFAVTWGQLLLIPGFGVILSLVMYGRAGWTRRALRILAVCELVIPGSILVLFGIGFVFDWISRSNADSLSRPILFVVFQILLLLGMPALVFFFAIWATRNSVPLEAARWLAERQAGTSLQHRHARIRGVRIASCIPCATVLLIFLFLLEIWGMLSHVRLRHAGDLPGYKVSIPATWIILNHGQSWVGSSSAWGLVGNGFASGLKPYFRKGAPLSSWGVEVSNSPHSHPIPRPGVGSLAERVFTIGNQEITCFDACPGCAAQEPRVIFINCSSEHGLRASFYGSPAHLPAFYKMIESITPTTK